MLKEVVREDLSENRTIPVCSEEMYEVIADFGRGSSRIGDKVSAHELYFGTKPNLRHLRVFGSIAYVHVPKEKRRKLDAKAKKCILVGYSDEQKGYKCYNPRTKQARVSRDVVFDESASWYLPPTPDLDSNLSSDDEVSEAEMPPDEPEIETREESPISLRLSGPNA